nr:hypothetical protein CFP56_19412 [Quercus suber]
MLWRKAQVDATDLRVVSEKLDCGFEASKFTSEGCVRAHVSMGVTLWLEHDQGTFLTGRAATSSPCSNRGTKTVVCARDEYTCLGGCLSGRDRVL